MATSRASRRSHAATRLVRAALKGQPEPAGAFQGLESLAAGRVLWGSRAPRLAGSYSLAGSSYSTFRAAVTALLSFVGWRASRLGELSHRRVSQPARPPSPFRPTPTPARPHGRAGAGTLVGGHACFAAQRARDYFVRCSCNDCSGKKDVTGGRLLSLASFEKHGGAGGGPRGALPRTLSPLQQDQLAPESRPKQSQPSMRSTPTQIAGLLPRAGLCSAAGKASSKKCMCSIKVVLDEGEGSRRQELGAWLDAQSRWAHTAPAAVQGSGNSSSSHLVAQPCASSAGTALPLRAPIIRPRRTGSVAPLPSWLPAQPAGSWVRAKLGSASGCSGPLRGRR